MEWRMAANILFVIDQFKHPNAGTEGQLLKLVEHLDRDKFAPQLLVFSDSNWLENNEFPCAVSVLNSQSLLSLVTWWRLLLFALNYRRSGGRLAHIFFNDPSIVCPPVFWLCGIKSFISRRDLGYWYTPTLLKILNVTRYFCAGVLVNSQAVANKTVQFEGFSPTNVHVIYNGFEPFVKSRQSVDELESLVKEKKLIVGIVANIRPLKRVSDLITALAHLKDRVPELVMVHIGDGNVDELHRLADELEIDNRVHFLGARSDIYSCLKYFDIAVLCSESEGFSNSIIEYSLAGIPVICTNVGGNPEAIKDGFNGYLYDVGDINALAQKLNRLASSHQDREWLGKIGQLNAIQRYSVSSMVHSYEEIYQQYLSEYSA